MKIHNRYRARTNKLLGSLAMVRCPKALFLSEHESDGEGLTSIALWSRDVLSIAELLSSDLLICFLSFISEFFSNLYAPKC